MTRARDDEAWAAFFKKHKVLVGLSVDGPRELHDTYRVDKGDKGSPLSAIARRGDTALIPAIVPRLDDENETVRCTAAAAIVRLGPGTGVRK